MQQRHINDPMVIDTLRYGKLADIPEPDLRHQGLLCRMSRYVAGMQVAVVVSVSYPSDGLVVVTVINVTRS